MIGRCAAGKAGYLPAREASIDKVTIVDSGGGQGVGKFADIVPNAVFGMLHQFKSLGIDPTRALATIGVDMEAIGFDKPVAKPVEAETAVVVEGSAK